MSLLDPKFKIGQVVCYDENDGLDPEYYRIEERKFDADIWFYKMYDGTEFNEDYLRPLTDKEMGRR